MPNYRRNIVPGGSFFFTVNLLERRSDLLVRHIGRLREPVKCRGIRLSPSPRVPLPGFSGCRPAPAFYAI